MNTEELLEYYKRELTYLRKMGAEFSQIYPKVAGRLELGMDQCPDPHIERLIESFAFLTGRIQYNLESEFPRISQALLGTLYPHFLSPVPSMSIARFEVDPDQGKLTSGHLIPKEMPLFARTEQEDLCRFRTCYPVTMWPLDLTYAGFESTDQFDFLDTMPNVSIVLRLRLESQIDTLEELEVSRLRFFINGDRMLAHSLYELLFGHVLNVAILPANGKAPHFLPAESILPVGFSPDEGVIPYPPNAHYGYRLLHEYFTFPEKYLFFDLDGLHVDSPDNHFDVLILLDQIPGSRLTIDQDTFLLGCTPIINLFSQITDPIRIDEKQSEYRIQPDIRREKITEIHSILSVSSSSDPRDSSSTIEPFYSYNHQMGQKDQKAFWFARRENTGREELPGTRMLISFVNLDFKTSSPPVETVYANTLCTNRRLAEQVPAGAVLQIERAAPIAHITTIGKPTAQLSPPLAGKTIWRLISHLSLNYLSLSGGEESLKSLREILRLYSFNDPTEVYQETNGIREMSCRRVVRRMGSEAWRGFCRGIEVTLQFDERMYVGSNAFLLAAVLNRFFSLYASVNSFTQLVIKSEQREGVWKIWQPMAGEQIVL